MRLQTTPRFAAPLERTSLLPRAASELVLRTRRPLYKWEHASAVFLVRLALLNEGQVPRWRLDPTTLVIPMVEQENRYLLVGAGAFVGLKINEPIFPAN